MTHPNDPQPVIGNKLKEKLARSWIPLLQQRLYAGERIVAMSRTTILRPMADGLSVTTARITAFSSLSLANGKVAVEVLGDKIARAEYQSKRFGGKSCLVVTTRSGEEINLGDVPADDAPMVMSFVQRLASTGLDPDVQRAATAHAASSAASDAAWASVRVVGNRPSDKAWRVIRDHASQTEVPWFVLGAEIAGGALAAFDDRCMIIKVGAMTSMMAGSFGGGRITTFPYTDITGIEYNSGMLNGVLEVLTASYQGSANKDYWRGTFKSVNSDNNNPWTLSNTLPIGKPIYQQAVPLLNEMRAKIAEAKRPTVVMNAPSSGGGGLADEIGKLAALRDHGVLTEQEFQSAKQGAIARSLQP